MPTRKQYRHPKCACGARKIDSHCTAIPSCDAFKRPAERVRSFERGRKVLPVGLPTQKEVRASFDRLGVAEEDRNPHRVFADRSPRVIAPFHVR